MLPRLAAASLVLLLAATSALALNPDDARGSPAHAVQVGGPGGDMISAYSGNLELSIPIGPTWELPGLSWDGIGRYVDSPRWWRHD